MPTAAVGDITMHYETEGSGDPLILIPYLSADHACFAFQAPEYSKHFMCVAVDLRGAGPTDKPAGPYSTVFEHLSHLGLHEDAPEFNGATLEFLTRQKL